MEPNGITKETEAILAPEPTATAVPVRVRPARPVAKAGAARTPKAAVPKTATKSAPKSAPKTAAAPRVAGIVHSLEHARSRRLRGRARWVADGRYLSRLLGAGLTSVKATAKRRDPMGEATYAVLELVHGGLEFAVRGLSRLEKAARPPARVPAARPSAGAAAKPATAGRTTRPVTARRVAVRRPSRRAPSRSVESRGVATPVA